MQNDEAIQKELNFYNLKTLFFCVFIFFLFPLSSFLFPPSWAFCDPIQINYNDGIYHIIIDGKKFEKKIQFVASESLMTNKEAHKKSGSLLTVNAGFFDPKNQKTISYIVNDSVTMADPLMNENLMMNPVLRKNIDKIVDRTEFRVIDCDGKYHYEIVPHKTQADFACNIVTSAQGGPMILPELKLDEEFFVVKDAEGNVVRESASVLHKVARTIIGLKGNDIHLLIITDKNPMTMYEVQDLCKKFGLERAMAFDGGSSTSMNYKDSISVVSNSDGGGRMLKSFLLIGK